MALVKRLQNAGAEERIWPTQFAFRTKRGSADAIFCCTETARFLLHTFLQLQVKEGPCSREIWFTAFVWRLYPGNLRRQDFHSPRVWSFIGFTYSVLWHFATMPVFSIPLFNLDRCYLQMPLESSTPSQALILHQRSSMT